MKKRLSTACMGLMLLALAPSTASAKIHVGKSLVASAAATAVAHAATDNNSASTTLLNKSGKAFNELVKKFSDDDLVALLKSEGYSGAKVKREGAIRIKIDGKTYMMYNSKRGDLQMYYGISGVDLRYKDVNQWNYEKKYSKAYLDKDMDVALESDLEAEAGLTRQQVLEFLDTFVGSVSVFRDFVREHDRSE
jgi:hypothetical protein